MTTILLTVVLVALLVAAMAIGIMFGRPPIKGSCGGMSALAGDKDCPICGGDRDKCEESESKSSSSPDVGTVRRFDPRRP
jgi:hypothetical protein